MQAVRSSDMRAAGILLHPTSLPGPDGVGDLGPAAYRFVDWLARARQGIWQVLPLGPTGGDNSPYAAASAFAGNPLLVSLERLRDLGIGPGPVADEPVVAQADFDRVRRDKLARLRRAWQEFAKRGDRVEQMEAQRADNPWLGDYALFAAIKDVQRGRAWTTWPEELRRRDPDALRRFHEEHRDVVGFHGFLQHAFGEQWAELKRYANGRGVRLMGDVPIFVAHDSADVWARSELFRLDAQGRPTEVAGVPPDYFSPTGQLWGNPLYRWDAMAGDGYAWWAERFRRLLSQVDLARIDHFRGFVAHWTVPAAEKTAIKGHWEPAPGAELFRAVERALGEELPFVAEDLGTITPDVEAVRAELTYPGMKVLHFAFGSDNANPYLPHTYQRDCVVYSGTHDNDTSVGWYKSLDEPMRHRVRHYLGVSGQDIAWDLIRAALASVADTAIVPLQDVLSLGSEARMNVPGQPLGNWAWRFLPGQLDSFAADRLGALTCVYARESVRRSP
jgi:4-alpha-glucanotransferase